MNEMASRTGNRIVALLLVGALALSGCASTTGWKPVVDRARDPHADVLDKDFEECEALAKQTTTQMAKEAGVGATIGAVIGGLAGLALSALPGGSKLGGSIAGAATGAAIGGTGGALSGDARYKIVYSNCLRKRGHPVLGRHRLSPDALVG